jgi:hypothetical protein
MKIGELKKKRQSQAGRFTPVRSDIFYKSRGFEQIDMLDIIAERSTGHHRNGMYDITGFSVLVFSCNVGNSASFAKDIETTISGISSLLTKSV